MPPPAGGKSQGKPGGPIKPRQWLLGNQFCRGYISSLFAAGGVGKTALRLLQFMSMALDRPLCDQQVFRRSRVLLISLEENDSGDMNFVCDLLMKIATENNIAVDISHHVHKGQIAPGDADAGRSRCAAEREKAGCARR